VVPGTIVPGSPSTLTDPSKPLGLFPPWQSVQAPSNGAPVLPFGGLPELANRAIAEAIIKAN
jgi:hypothetical protein